MGRRGEVSEEKKGSLERSGYNGGGGSSVVGDRELEMEDRDWVIFDLVLDCSVLIFLQFLIFFFF